MEVPAVPRGKVCCLLALDAARPEDQPALVADHEAVLTALALGLGRPPQQAAMAAPLQTQAETRWRSQTRDTADLPDPSSPPW